MGCTILIPVMGSDNRNHVAKETRESHPSVHDLQSTTRLNWQVVDYENHLHKDRSSFYIPQCSD